ncbi:hypothetical protein RCL1_005779 [Eukaryota sp. TZLM3-RCL]
MSKPLTCKEAIKLFEERTQENATQATVVKLNGMLPPIDRFDASLNSLVCCEHLALSSNNIDRIGNLQGLRALKILSLGRNRIKRLENLEAVSGTLEQLWISYNLIERLAGIEKLRNLKTLFISNNLIASLAEIDRLSGLPLEELVLVGNPVTQVENYREEIGRRLPNLKKLDGVVL